MNKQPTQKQVRQLALMFLYLPRYEKTRLAHNMQLIEDEDGQKNEVEQTQAYFKRANDRGLLKDLWDEIAAIKGLTGKNPFA